MPDLLRGTSVGSANKKVFFGYQEVRPLSSGLLVALTSLTFEVIAPDASTHTASTPVNVATDTVLTNLYYASFSTNGADPLGEYTVIWTYTAENGDSGTATTKFNLWNEAYPLVNGYAQVEDLLSEGVPLSPAAGGYTALRMASRLEKASRFVEDFCLRVFYPKVLTPALDGRGVRALRLEQPIIAIAEAVVIGGVFQPSPAYFYDNELFVYNRHIRQGLLNPDDRESPRIELYGRGQYSEYYYDRNYGDIGFSRFQDFQHNIRLDGVFGYTDPDGTAFGRTPYPIKDIVMRLAMKELDGLWERTGFGSDYVPGGPKIAEKTFDQTIEFANLVFAQDGTGSAYTGLITGDPQIDRILAMYRAPARLGSA